MEKKYKHEYLCKLLAVINEKQKTKEEDENKID